MPGIVVIEVDTARGRQAFRNGGAAVLGCSEQPHELDREVFPVRPTGPTGRAGVKSHADIQSVIPLDDLVNRCALGKPKHHVANAWRPVISDGPNSMSRGKPRRILPKPGTRHR